MTVTIEQLQKKKRKIVVTLNSYKTSVTSNSATTTMGTVDSQIKRLADLRKELQELIDEVSDLCSDVAAFQPAIKEFAETMDQIEQVTVLATQFKDTLAPAPSTTTTSKTLEVRLPKLELPTFSGDRMEWMGFRDLFVSSVHRNCSLSGAQKMQYP